MVALRSDQLEMVVVNSRINTDLRHEPGEQRK